MYSGPPSRVLAILFVLLLCPAAFSQFTSVRNSPPEQTGEYELTGTVENSVTGEPISRALVQLPLNPPRAAFTDSEGKFRFEDLPAVQVMVLARKPGFFSSQDLHRVLTEQAVKIGPDASSVVVRLIPEGLVTGTVTAADGSPLEGISITLERPVIGDGRKRWEQTQHKVTDEDGVFRIAGLQPGSYMLRAESVSGRMTSMSDEVYRRVYYPGVDDRSSATPLEVQPGRVLQADLTLRAERGFRVAVHVIGCPEARGANLQWVDASGEAAPIAWRSLGDRSYLALRVPAGAYTLRVSALDKQQACRGQQHVTVGGNLNDVVVAIQPSAPIPVTVRTEFTKPALVQAEGSTIIVHGRELRTDTPRVNVRLTRVGPEHFEAYAMPDPQDGGSAIRDVEPGRYTVEVTPNGAWYVQSASYGTADLTEEELVITPGERKPIEIVLRDDVASLTGRVRLEPSEHAIVLLLPPAGSLTPVRQVYAAGDGVFRVDGLAPGDYQLLAFDSIDDIEYANRDALRPYLSKAARATLSANDKATVELDLIRRGVQ